jgi:hypothetical protein
MWSKKAIIYKMPSGERNGMELGKCFLFLKVS